MSWPNVEGSCGGVMMVAKGVVVMAKDCDGKGGLVV